MQRRPPTLIILLFNNEFNLEGKHGGLLRAEGGEGRGVFPGSQHRGFHRRGAVRGQVRPFLLENLLARRVGDSQLRLFKGQRRIGLGAKRFQFLLQRVDGLGLFIV